MPSSIRSIRARLPILTATASAISTASPRISTISSALGIDAIWLNPINPSPLDDWGYDVSDYCGIHPDLGDLAAFDRLMGEAHRRGIRVIVDLVPNHTSNQHPWFVESRASRSNPKRDWYIWVPGSPDRAPNNWQSTFGGSAWKYDPTTASWYLHMFLEQQPDLNYRNHQVVDAMHDVIRFWLDRGADGFRIDVIAGLIKDAELRDNPIRDATDPDIPWHAKGTQDPLYSHDRPEVHDIIRGFRRVSDSYEQRILVGETWPREHERLADFLRPDEMQLAFNFRFLLARYDARRFRAAIEQTERSFGPGAWPTWTLSNHDFPRHISRYSRDGDGEARARVAAVMLFALRGTPFIYYGEEIGMRDAAIPADRKRDPVGRDGCRSPMQWTDAPNGGFSSSADTWLPCGDFKAVNVARQLNDPTLDALALSPTDPTPQIDTGTGRGKLSRLRGRARRLSRLPSRYTPAASGRRAEFHRRAARDRYPSRQNLVEHDSRSLERFAISANA